MAMTKMTGAALTHMAAGDPPGFDPIGLVVDRTGCSPAAISCDPLAHGHHNQRFRLTGAFGDWLVKRVKPGNNALTLFPDMAKGEARALTILGPLGISPRLVDFIDDPDHGAIVIHSFHEGAAWPGGAGAADGPADTPGLAAVARLLRRLHRLTVDGFRDVPVMPADILAQGDQFLLRVGRLHDLWRLRPTPLNCPVLLRRSLLHTNVGAGNLLLGPQGLRLVDWQSAALGDAAEDLCAFLSPASQILHGRPVLTPEQRVAFLLAYDDRRVSERLHLLEPFFHWRLASYCCMRQQQSAAQDPDAAATYERALAAVTRLLAESCSGRSISPRAGPCRSDQAGGK